MFKTVHIDVAILVKAEESYITANPQWFRRLLGNGRSCLGTFRSGILAQLRRTLSAEQVIQAKY
jgi:hypothetical protein